MKRLSLDCFAGISDDMFLGPSPDERAPWNGVKLWTGGRDGRYYTEGHAPTERGGYKTTCGVLEV
jgi:hypothetical protein